MSITRSEKSTPGIGIATEPVASTIALAWCSSSPTFTLPPPESEASPLRNSALFLFQRNWTPSSRVLETFVAALLKCLPVDRGLPALMPSSAPSSLTEWKISAVWRTVFAGMQA